MQIKPALTEKKKKGRKRKLRKIKNQISEQLDEVVQIEQYLKNDCYETLYRSDLNPEKMKEQEEANKTIFEGKLERLKPGLSKTLFLEKWVQITKQAVLVHKNELSAGTWGAKPQLTIPFHFLSHVERVHVIVPHTDGHSDRPYQFEIFLKDEMMPTVERNDALRKTMEQYSTLVDKTAARKVDQTVLETYEDIPRLLNGKRKQKRSKCKKCSKKTFRQFLSQSLSKPVYEYAMESSSPNSWLPSLKGVNTWSNRKIEWARSQNRFVFACESEVICDKWVTVLNWITSGENKPDLPL